MVPPAEYQRIHLVFHPNSGKGLGARRVTELETLLFSLGLRPRRLDTSKISGSALGEALGQADAVVVIGGDGLIHHVIKHLARTRTPMGIVPAGSGNDTWRMSSARTVEQTLQDVVRFLTGDIEARPVDLLELKYANQDSQTKLAIGAVSWGFEGLVNGRANELPRSLGALRYLVGLVLSLPKLQPHRTVVHSEEFDFRGQIYAASIANIRSVGGGITLFPQADYTDGLADISLVSGNRLHKVLPYVGHILCGRKHPYREIARSSQVNVQTTEASYADGELLGHGDFELSVLHHALLLIPGADSR